MSETKPRIFLARPTYDGWRHDGSADGVRMASRRYAVLAQPNIDSNMDRNFNVLWCQALELRDRGQATHFAMIHADVAPDEYWLDTFIDVLAARGADLVSAIVPIKDGHGLTSTAIAHPTDPWTIERRLTMHEVMQLPETFGDEICPGRRLLVNNGLWLCDLRRDWCDHPDLCNNTQNRIVREKFAGVVKRTVQCVPQDWQFSRDAQRLGATVVATRKVPAIHHGATIYGNWVAWGEWQWDQEFQKGPLPASRPVIESTAPEELTQLLRRGR